MELPTSNRKKLLTFDWLVLSQKSTLFPFFGRSYLGNRLTYIAENLHRFFSKHYLQVCQISSKSEGGLANLAKNWLIWHGMTPLTRSPNHQPGCRTSSRSGRHDSRRSESPGTWLTSTRWPCHRSCQWSPTRWRVLPYYWSSDTSSPVNSINNNNDNMSLI